MFARLHRLSLLLALADLMVIQLALGLADHARRALPFGAPLDAHASLLNPGIQLIVALVFPATFLTLSVYDIRRGSRAVGDPYGVVRAAAVSTFVFAGVLYFSYRDLPRLLVLYFFFFQLAGLLGLRGLLMLRLRRLHRQGRALSRVLVVGAGEAAALVVGAIRSHMGNAVEVLGCADDGAEEGPGGLPILGRLADVPDLVRTRAVDEVVLALPSEAYSQIEALAYALLDQAVRVRLVPDYLRLVVVQSSVESLGGVPLIGLREPRISGLAWLTKRFFDLALTTLLILLTWPLMLLIAVAVRLDSPGPAIFRQQRVGENGRLFWMYKFRTMVTDAERRGPQVMLDPEGHPIYKWPDDARVTRVGHLLRRTSLDELPQFLNVLKGDMSLVGPRPEVRYIVERYEPWQRQRLAVPPGITGWWQVSGRSDLPMHLNTQFDLYYIRNYSLWLDLQILLKTIGVVLRGQGAY